MSRCVLLFVHWFVLGDDQLLLEFSAAFGQISTAISFIQTSYFVSFAASNAAKCFKNCVGMKVHLAMVWFLWSVAMDFKSCVCFFPGTHGFHTTFLPVPGEKIHPSTPGTKNLQAKRSRDEILEDLKRIMRLKSKETAGWLVRLVQLLLTQIPSFPLVMINSSSSYWTWPWKQWSFPLKMVISQFFMRKSTRHGHVP